MAKKNASGAGSIRKRKDGTWEARYTAGRDPATGKQVQRSLYGKTQREVRQRLSQITTELDGGTYTAPQKITVADWCKIWLDEYTLSVKPGTRKSYSNQIRNHIAPALGNVQLSRLTAPMVQRFYNELSSGTGGKKALSPSSIKIVHGVLRQALQKAMEVGYIRSNPATLCALPRVEKQEIKPLNDSQIKAFLAAIEGHRMETLFKVDLFTGMREGEILGLQWDRVDFDKGTIIIDKQLRNVDSMYRLTTVKNDKPRTISPAPWVMKLLKAHQISQTEQRLKIGYLWDNHWNLVFTDEIGHYLVHETVYWNFKRIARKIGVPDARFHDLRHTYAVSSIRAGDDVKTIQTNLGHATAAFTLEIYAHVTEQMKQESARRMDAFIKGVLEL